MDLFLIPKRPKAWKFLWILILAEIGIIQQITKTAAPQNFVGVTYLCMRTA